MVRQEDISKRLKRVPEAEFFVIGKNPSSEVKRLSELPGVRVTGYVDNVGDYLRNARTVAIPLRLARGVQNKVLEAMAYGVPVVATGAATDGLEAVPGQDLIVADRPEEFSEMIVRLLEDDMFNKEISENGRKLVEARYNWKRSVSELERLLLGLLKPAVAQTSGIFGRWVEAMSEGMIISFIIPALNAEGFLPQCLSAIRAQKFHGDYEMIVIDNGSSDKTVEIATLGGASVHHAPGKTVAAVRNIGAKLAKGEFLACVDADCVIWEGWVEAALRHFSDAGVAAAGAPPLAAESGTGWRGTGRSRGESKKRIQSVPWLGTANLVIRKSAFVECGGFNETLVTCEDVDLGYRLCEKYKMVSDPAVKSTHLGEAKTLKEFFRKETWRGKGNLQGALAHGLLWHENPEPHPPALLCTALALMPLWALWSMAAKTTAPLALGAALVLWPAAALSVRTVMRNHCWKSLAPVLVLYLVYGVARAAALLPARK